MKDILITVISVLLTILIIICMARGITIGTFKISSIPDIKAGSLKLDSEIEELNNLKNVTYKKKLDELQNATKRLTTAKQAYLDLASISTDSEIQQANQEQTYAMEFLWNKVGSYATKEGLALTWNVASSNVKNKYTLSFTVSGGYIAIINYVYALENDAELAFKIENFKMISGGTVASSGSNSSTGDVRVTATFTVSNIGIKEETITATSNSTGRNNMNLQSNNNTDNSENGTTNQVAD